ncbi:MAG: DUF6314 family protein [Bacteroidota bacterium]
MNRYNLMPSATDNNPVQHALTRLWKQLGTITQLSFSAQSGNGAAGWNGMGKGRVDVTPATDVILFREAGTWQTATGQTLAFRNVFRWTRNLQLGHIQLEHLRYGENQPVFLFDLVGIGAAELTSAEPHHCAADVYTGQLVLEANGFTLDWYIQGPRKDEHIRYQYS